MISYIQICQLINSFVSSHYMLKRFYSDAEDQISTYSTLDESFPILYMCPNDGSEYGFTQNTLSLRFYCFDRIIRDRSNWKEIMSDTHRCLNDLYKYLQSPPVELIDINQTGTPTQLNDGFMDYVAGWYLDINIPLDTYSGCGIMRPDSDYIIQSICESNTPFCVKLGECDIIIDIQNELDNKLDCSGLTGCGVIQDIQQEITNLKYTVSSISLSDTLVVGNTTDNNNIILTGTDTIISDTTSNYLSLNNYGVGIFHLGNNFKYISETLSDIRIVNSSGKFENKIFSLTDTGNSYFEFNGNQQFFDESRSGIISLIGDDIQSADNVTIKGDGISTPFYVDQTGLTSISIDHNDTGNLNTGDYLHLTQNEYDDIFNTFDISINFIDVETFNYRAPEDFLINSVINPDGLSYSILLNSSTYSVGGTVSYLDTLELTPDGSGFLKLNCEKL